MSSLWLDSELKNFEKLQQDIEVDVCIVGGGILGITCGYYLSNAGLKVAVLERDKIGSKTTGHTTGKITIAHDLFYKYLIDTFGTNFAKGYLDANLEAISNIDEIVKKENINCDFEIQNNYIFTNNTNDKQKIQDEVISLETLGFNAKYMTKIPAPISHVAAICYPNQAQFNSIKYIYSLCDKILSRSASIYENTIVYDIQKDKNEYITYVKDYKVRSKYVILASHYPIINAPGFYFLKMYQSTSYIIGVDTKQELFEGMYINIDSPTISLRTAKYNDSKILLVGGSDHKTGSKIDLSNSYKDLENIVNGLYPNSKVLYKWEAEDCISLDKIPYIGEFSTLMPNFYVATGFKKWGMTSSNVASKIITNKILGKENKYEDIFLSTRFHPIKNYSEMGNILKETSYSLVINKFKLPKDKINDISNDEGKIISINEQKIGVYKDKTGKIFAIKPICSHLGCELSFNNLGKNWDCPCHGSRFKYTGESIADPSIKGLDVLDYNLE